ncbi:MAG: DUF2798 domain-containing protein [Paracoccaceae bacterium]
MNKKVKMISGIIMSGIMAVALSGFFTLTKIGFAPGWQSAWGVGFITAWPIALGLSVLIARPVRLLAISIARRATPAISETSAQTFQN